jgi:hypothetical protein
MARMIAAVAGFHITLYSVPSMRLQRRPSAAPRCSRGRSWEWRLYPGDRRARSPGEFTAALLRRRRGGGGPEPPGGPGDDQQHDDNGPDPRTTRGLSLEFIVRPLRSLRPPQLRPRGGLRASPRTSRTRRRAASRNGGPLPPFTRIGARMIQDSALSRADSRRRGRGCLPRLDRPATARLYLRTESMRAFPHMSRRRLLGLAATAAAMPRLRPLPSVRADAAARGDLRFRALWRGSSIGEHRVAFGTDGDRLVVDTHVDIAVRVLFFNVFRLRHDAQESGNPAARYRPRARPTAMVRACTRSSNGGSRLSVPAAVCRNRGDAVLGAARLGSDHHAPGRRLAHPRPLTHQS